MGGETGAQVARGKRKPAEPPSSLSIVMTLQWADANVDRSKTVDVSRACCGKERGKGRKPLEPLNAKSKSRSQNSVPHTRKYSENTTYNNAERRLHHPMTPPGGWPLTQKVWDKLTPGEAPKAAAPATCRLHTDTLGLLLLLARLQEMRARGALVGPPTDRCYTTQPEDQHALSRNRAPAPAH